MSLHFASSNFDFDRFQRGTRQRRGRREGGRDEVREFGLHSQSETHTLADTYHAKVMTWK